MSDTEADLAGHALTGGRRGWDGGWGCECGYAACTIEDWQTHVATLAPEFHCDDCGSDTHDTVACKDEPVPAHCIHIDGCSCAPAPLRTEAAVMATLDRVLIRARMQQNARSTRFGPYVQSISVAELEQILRAALADPGDERGQG